MRRKLVASVVVACMVLCSACGNTGSVEKGEQETSVAEQEAAESDSVETAEDSAVGDVSFPLKESIKLSVFIPQNSDVVDLKDNLVFQELQEATNIDFDLNAVPGQDAGEKLNLLLASGEYPEVIIGNKLKCSGS